MAKPNKESIITDILIELNGVNNQRGEVLAKVGNKWQLSERTFDRIWKDANSRHEIIQFEQQNKLAEQSTAINKKLVIATNITKESLLLELEEVKELAKVPDNAGRINTQAVIKAIEVQAKMLGLNEAQKQELIINKGFYLELDKDGE
jgi:hypothetical protein